MKGLAQERAAGEVVYLIGDTEFQIDDPRVLLRTFVDFSL